MEQIDARRDKLRRLISYWSNEAARLTVCVRDPG
jgi:hypothetical protein